jgi:ABC-type protease/lipase transport system fused ATPase/permease subunit
MIRQFMTGNGIFAFFDTPWVPIYIAVLFLMHPYLGWLAIVFALIQGVLAWLGHGQTVAAVGEGQHWRRATCSNTCRASCATPRCWRAWACSATCASAGTCATRPT